MTDSKQHSKQHSKQQVWQYQAIGWLWGFYRPEPDRPWTGTLCSNNGLTIPAHAKGRVLTYLKEHISPDLSPDRLAEIPQLWTVYPRTMPHFNVTLTWVRHQPSIDEVVHQNRFRICGILNHRYENAAILEVRYNRPQGGKAKILKSGHAGFTIKVDGTLPEGPLHHPWMIEAELVNQSLHILTAELLPLPEEAPANNGTEVAAENRGSLLPTRSSLNQGG